MKCGKPVLKELMENSDRLDAEGKAKLIKHLLGEPGLQG
jgi:hypothetical protein